MRESNGHGVVLASLTLEPGGRSATATSLPSSSGLPPAYYVLTAPAGTYTLRLEGEDDGLVAQQIPGLTYVDEAVTLADLVMAIQPGWDIASLTLDPATAEPGSTVTATLTLTGPVPSGNGKWITYVNPSSDNPGVILPGRIEFAAGDQIRTFTVTIGETATGSATVRGTFGKRSGPWLTTHVTYPGRTESATLTILAPRVTALTLDPTTVEPGATSTGTVTLDIPARPGGTTVTLSTSNAAVATVPASVLVPEGATTATFTVSTLASAPASSVTVTAAAGGSSKTATLALALPRLFGVAPGWTLAGTADVIAYGAGFDQGSSVVLEGPVYALGAYQTPLCDVVTFGCPTQTLPATVDAAGATATFTAPAGLATGLYRVTVRRSGGLTTPTSAWLGIDEASKTVPAQTPEEHRYAQAIHSGQTITGSFVADGDPDGTYGDLNSYYFMAGAGARVSAILERVDTTKTWEHPDSLDPELLIATPAGYVPQNLAAYDIQPGVDLNARLVNAVLPVSGLYVITAATTKGAGAYRLHFEMTQPGTVAGGARVVPYAQRAVTMRQGSTVAPTAMVLDGRGLRLSGARVGLGVVSNPGDTGAVTFTATTVASNPDGTAQTTLTATAQGRVEIAATALDGIADPPLPQAQQLAAGEQGTASGASQLARIPRYQPVAYRPFVVTEAFGDLSIGLAAGKLEKVPAQRLRGARPGEQGAGQRGELRAHPPAGGTKAGGQASGHPAAQSTLEARPSAPDPAFDLPMDASTAVPLPEPEAEALALSTAGILACDQPTFALGIVPSDTELHPPYTFTLSDLTPPAGGSQPQGEVGADGITGHRIESTIRLKLEVKDALGQTPTHPVLVQLAVDGARHGHLVFDPDGTRRTCTSGAVLWHEPDGQGGVIPNDEVELTLGTLALWAGERPNPQDPSHVLPVWGTAEVLDVAVQPIVDGAPAAPSVRGVRVHTEPGRPDHLSCAPDREDDCTTPWRLWADFAWNTDPVSGHPTVGPYTVHNLLFLHDPYDNVTFGQTATQATSGDPRVTPTFTDQTAGGTTFNACGYTVALKWEADPTMPAGQVPVTLEVERAADPDWGSGTIAKTLTLAFEQGASHCLVNAQHYDRRNGQAEGMEEGTFPLTVAPRAGAGGLPTTALGDTPRLVLLALVGSDVPGYLLTAGTEPGPEPDHQWRWHTQPAGWQYDETESSTPHAALELADQPSFRFAIVDLTGDVVPGTRFRVHRCPRYEHLTAPLVSPGDCILAPVDSDGETGILPSLTLNEGGGPNGRGYLGIELTKAPVAPGTYYVRVESLNGAQYRIRMGSDLSHAELDPQEEYAGAYALCSVAVAEFLDQDFARIEQLVVEGPTSGFIRYLNPSELKTVNSVTLNVSTYNEAGGLTSSEVPVPVSRIGQSGTFLGPVTFKPTDVGGGSSSGRARSTAQSAPELLTPYIEGRVVAEREDEPIAWVGLITPARLRLEWLGSNGEPTANGQAEPFVRRVPWVDDPTHYAFLEVTKLRVVAETASGQALPNLDAVIRLDEAPNPAFPGQDLTLLTTTRNWQFSYQGEAGLATNLRPDRGRPSSMTAVALVAGKTDELELSSLAGPRILASDLPSIRDPAGRGDFCLNWEATVRACDASSGEPCVGGSGTGVRLRAASGSIPQWVDRVAFERPLFGSEPGLDEEHNGVRDWLEAAIWYALLNPPVASELVEGASDCIGAVEEDDTAGLFNEFARVTSNAYHTLVVVPRNFLSDAFRQDGRFASLEHGFKRDSARILTTTAFHEARHCWQYKMSELHHDDLDVDSDLLFSDPLALDPLARRLADSQHVTIGKQNPEGQFKGDAVVFTDLNSEGWRNALERDARLFERRSTEGTAFQVSLSPMVDPATRLSPVAGSITLARNERRESAVEVMVFVGGGCPADIVKNTGCREFADLGKQYVVELRVEPMVGLAVEAVNTPIPNTALLVGCDECSVTVAVTDEGSGIASFALQGVQPGTYTCTLTVRQVNVEGLTLSDENMIPADQRSFSVEVRQ